LRCRSAYEMQPDLSAGEQPVIFPRTAQTDGSQDLHVPGQ